MHGVRRCSEPLTRRQAICTAAATAMALGTGRRACAAPAPRILETKVISQTPDLYCGWSTVARRRNGELLVSYSGGREGHVCPFGRVELIRSTDEGRTWSAARVILDTPLDDRDSGVLETASGTLLVTTFTSLDYQSILSEVEKIPPGDRRAWAPERLKPWQAAPDALGP